MSEPVEVVRAASLGETPHGFLGRRGGVSTGPTASLDLGRRGAATIGPALAENRRRAVAAATPGATLATAWQVHSTEVAVVGDDWEEEARPHADALVTDRPKVALGVLTADCAPVLFADPSAGVVGAAHAGWRGALAGVTDRTIAAMERLGADRSRIAAAVGPCIARASYEVDEAFAARFFADDPGNERFFAAAVRAGHLRFDLEAYVAARLAAAGVGWVETLGLDTYALPARFYSFRRATHRGEPDYGRQMSLIALP